MADEACRAFNLKDAEIECRTVTNPRWELGCAAIRFSLPAGSKADGWQEYEDFLPDATV